MDTISFLITGLALCTGVGLLAYGMGDLITQRRALLRRLGVDHKADDVLRAPPPLVLEDPRQKSFERLIRPGDERDLSRTHLRLSQAGYRGRSAVRLYYTYKWTIAFVGVILSSLVLPRWLEGSSYMLSIPVFALAMILSLFVVDLWIDRRIVWRKTQIEYGLPEAFDLLLVCMEAGHGLDQAFLRVAHEMKRSNAVLAEELSIFVAELAVGKARAQALADLAKRTNVPSVTSLANVIRQADKFGVSIADTLRIYAKEMRDRRFIKAEERANMMPVKLAITTVLLTIYPLLLIIVGPAIILILRRLS